MPSDIQTKTITQLPNLSDGAEPRWIFQHRAHQNTIRNLPLVFEHIAARNRATIKKHCRLIFQANNYKTNRPPYGEYSARK